MANIYDIIPIIISLFALAISLYTHYRKQKSDQFHTALEIHNQLEASVNRLIEIDGRLHDDKLSDYEKKYLLNEKRSKALEYLNIIEFLSLLINNKEININSLKKHFKPTVVEESAGIFKEFPDFEKDGKGNPTFEEISNLIAKWKD